MVYFRYMPTTAQKENVAWDVLKSIVRFPVWWYTTGVVYTMQRLARSVKYYARSLAIGVWVRNIFVPMYGFADWQSRIISVFMRSAQIFFRGAALLVWISVCAVQFVLYLALPVITVTMIIYHLYV